jgi:hypothetical protein
MKALVASLLAVAIAGTALSYLNDCYWHGLDAWVQFGRCIVGLRWY